MIYKPALAYNDVLLVPKYSDIVSRKEVDISSALDSTRTLRLPIISSPMDTITESSMANCMAKAGGLGVIHRYNSIEIQAQQAYQVSNRDYKRLFRESTGTVRGGCKDSVSGCSPWSPHSDEKSHRESQESLLRYSCDGRQCSYPVGI